MGSARVRQLTANKRYLFFANLFTEIKSINVVIQLFYVARGLSLSEIFYLSLILSVVILLTEFPSSVLADHIGRKKTFMAGIVFFALGNLVTLFAQGFWPMVLGVSLSALGFAFNSGTDEALLYDTLKELKQESFSAKVSGKYFSSSNFAKIFMPLIASFIARDLLAWQFNFLLMIDLLGCSIAFFIATQLVEPKRSFNLAKRYKVIIKEAFKLILKDTVLLRFAINQIGIFIATFVYWRVYQVYLTEHGLGVFELGLVYAAFQTVLFLGLWNTEVIKKRVGIYTMFQLPQIIGLLALIAIALLPSKAVLVVGTIALFSVGTVRDSMFLSQIQARIKSFNRATTTSALSVIKSLLFIPILLGSGYIIEAGTVYAVYIALGLFVLTSTFANIRRQDLINEA